MSEFVVNNLIKTAAVPVAVSAIVALLLSSLFAKKRPDGGWIAGLALLAGFATGFFLIAGFSGFPPIKIADWLPYSTAIVFLAHVALGGLGFRFRITLTIVTVALLLWLYLRPIAPNREIGELLAAAAILGGLWALLWFGWAWGAERREPLPEWLLVMVVAGTAASLVSVLDGSALLGQLGGVLAASCGGLFLIVLFRPGLTLGAVPNAVFLSAFGALLAVAHLYAEVSGLGLALAFASGLAVLAGCFSGYRGLSTLKRGIVAVSLAALPAVIAIVYLVRTATHDDYGY